ncbi:Gypsy retrotransposon integrase-like protein 1 [Paramarasmius palmivorus]|uniref:Gypsy retrotransposon integrase-like protein 1 n=1 Tax=Paramarasmius palmivorus TaxID=297713 RepID=A0AAW0CTK0_9AGAR
MIVPTLRLRRLAEAKSHESESFHAQGSISYVEGLESRIEELERLLRQVVPEKDLQKVLEASGIKTVSSTGQDITSGAPASELSEADFLPLHVIRQWDSAPPETKENMEARNEENEDLMMSYDFKRLSLGDPRFFGKSSGAMLVKTAIDLRDEYTGSVTDLGPLFRGQRRPEYWLPPVWERNLTQGHQYQYEFPEADLMSHLVDLYFKNVNCLVPLLHRPSFERSIEENLHQDNELFGAVLLLVCAIASRYTDDMRVLLEGSDSWLSCGWKWYKQVEHIRKSIWSPPTLYHLHFYCGCSDPHASWTIIGTGIRVAQEMGAHRRRLSTTPTVEGEQMKRAFWALVCMDCFISAKLGRPCAIQDEDFDLEMPIECDDEYWEHPDPKMAFRQPPGRPSYVSAFVTSLKLMKITGMVLRSIYSISKSKMLLGLAGPKWEQRMVAELDSALNQWVDAIPEHLRWDPNREDELFFNQSGVLYAQYYETQIFIHRSFIPTPKRPSPLTFPSLAICTNAARSCTHIVDTQRRRKGFLLPINLSAVFVSGIVLLSNIWAAKRSGMTIDPNREMAEVHKCMQVLRACESRDILYELACVGELPLPKGPQTQNKRQRNSDTPSPASAVDSPESSYDGETAQARSIAGSKRAMTSFYATTSTSATAQSHQPIRQQLSSLPTYSDELGRLPLHGQLSYSSQGNQVAAVDASSGYWFCYPQGTTNVAAPSQVAHDLSLPAGYPTLSDAEFFDQLSSMGWWNGENGISGNGGDMATVSTAREQHETTEPLPGRSYTMWPASSFSGQGGYGQF